MLEDYRRELQKYERDVLEHRFLKERLREIANFAEQQEGRNLQHREERDKLTMMIADRENASDGKKQFLKQVQEIPVERGQHASEGFLIGALQPGSSAYAARYQNSAAQTMGSGGGPQQRRQHQHHNEQ